MLEVMLGVLILCPFSVMLWKIYKVVIKLIGFETLMDKKPYLAKQRRIKEWPEPVQMLKRS